MRKSMLFVTALVGACGLSGSPAAAHHGGESLQGEIVEASAYLRSGLEGADRWEPPSTAKPAVGDTLLFIQEGTGTLYLLLPEKPGDDPYALAREHVNHSVQVKGHAFERRGVHGLVVELVERLPE